MDKAVCLNKKVVVVGLFVVLKHPATNAVFCGGVSLQELGRNHIIETVPSKVHFCLSKRTVKGKQLFIYLVPVFLDVVRAYFGKGFPTDPNLSILHARIQVRRPRPSVRQSIGNIVKMKFTVGIDAHTIILIVQSLEKQNNLALPF
jgi:hypothetical protein